MNNVYHSQNANLHESSFVTSTANSTWNHKIKIGSYIMDTYFSNEDGQQKWRLIKTPDDLFPSMASFFSWQLEHRKGPSQGRNFRESGAPSCIEIPSPGFISTWHTAHINNLNMLQTGYLVSNLHFRQTYFIVKRKN